MIDLEAIRKRNEDRKNSGMIIYVPFVLAFVIAYAVPQAYSVAPLIIMLGFVCSLLIERGRERQ